MSRSKINHLSLCTFALSAVVQLAQVACGDTILLKDGTRLDGIAKRTAAGWTVVKDTGESVELSADSVASIEVGPHAHPTTGTTESGGSTTGSHSATAAQENLASLRRSVEVLSNPAVVIERYRRFIDQSVGTTASTEAKADLAIWQDRQDRGLIKVGPRWVTPEEKAEMASRADATAKEAAAQLEQGRTADAVQTIQTALDADAQNPGALYLRGLILFQKDQVVAARKAFEAMLAVTPDNGAGLNNYAVILWKQKQPMAALQNYDRSITAWPIRKPILDNVAEALAAVPPDQQKNPIALKLAKKFAVQDAQLQVVMARNGQYRWGATWVDQPTLDKLKATEKTINDKLAEINANAATAQTRINEIDRLTATNNNTMSQLQASAYARDSEGHLLQLPVPPAFYTLQNENERMAGERATLLQKLQALSDDAKKTRQSMPVPLYTGVQRTIGIEGMPGSASTQPSTQASSQPSTQPGGDPGITVTIGPSDTLPTTLPTTVPTPTPNTAPSGGPVLIPLP